MSRALPIKRQGALTEDKAWLLGFLAGDGNVTIEEDGGAHVSANCGNSEGDEQLAEHVAGLFREIYEIPASVRLQGRDPYENREPYWQPITYRKNVALDLRSFGPLGTYDWRVPRRIRHSLRLSAAWASGFFDADGHARFNLKRSARSVTASSVNETGLREVPKILERLGIRSSWHSEPEGRGEGWSPGHYVIVCDRRSLERFAEVVGFRCSRKAELLQQALGSYKREHPNLLRHEVEERLPDVLRLRAQGAAFAKIAEDLGLATAQVAKGMIKRASKKAGDLCLICQEAEATHSVPRVVRGRSSKYVCEPCLERLEPEAESWGDELVQLKLGDVAEFLDQHHYLGRRSGRSAFALRNKHGVLAFSRSPQAAPLPRDWFELSRWCIVSDEDSAGTRQWAQARAWLLKNTDTTTVVSYSDPSRHDGALYRAAGWLWAPSGQFLLKGLSMAKERHPEAPYVDKVRWIYPLRPDPRRADKLTIRHPWLWNHDALKWLCEWPEPTWSRRGTARGGGKDFKRWTELLKLRAAVTPTPR